MLSAYRRHTDACPHRSKGQHYTLCNCPIWCYGTTPEGALIRQSLKTRDWARGEQRLQHVELGGDLYESRPNSPDLRKAIADYLESSKSRNLEKGTIDSYDRTLDHLAAALGGSRPMASITVEAVDAAMRGRKIKPRTRRKELEHLRAFFAWCWDRRWIDRNPAKSLRAPLIEDLATLPFTPAEVAKLIEACDEISSDNPEQTAYVRKRARALVYTLLYSGLRISDVAKLKRSALSRDTRHLSLRMMKTGAMLKVLLHEDAAESLKALPVVDSPEYFFWSGRGDLITCVKNLRRTIARLGILANVKAHPHRFRDTFAVELLTEGADIRAVQQLLGHQSVRTTEKHYAHFIAAHQVLLDRAAARLNFQPKSAGPLLVKPRQRRRRNA